MFGRSFRLQERGVKNDAITDSNRQLGRAALNIKMKYCTEHVILISLRLCHRTEKKELGILIEDQCN